MIVNVIDTISLQRYTPILPPPKRKQKDEPVPLVSYDDTEGVGNIDETISTLRT